MTRPGVPTMTWAPRDSCLQLDGCSSGRRRSAARGSRAGGGRSFWNASATWIASSRVGVSTSACGLRQLDVDLFQQRQREGGGLAGAGLRLADQVAAFEQDGDALGLDRRRGFVADFAERFEKCFA